MDLRIQPSNIKKYSYMNKKNQILLCFCRHVCLIVKWSVLWEEDLQGGRNVNVFNTFQLFSWSLIIICLFYEYGGIKYIYQRIFIFAYCIWHLHSPHTFYCFFQSKVIVEGQNSGTVIFTEGCSMRQIHYLTIIPTENCGLLEVELSIILKFVSNCFSTILKFHWLRVNKSF